MSFDNRIFDVNGQDESQLLAAIKLVFAQKNEKTVCRAWSFKPSIGLILLWYQQDRPDVHTLPSGLTADECFPFVKSWLHSDDAKQVTQDGLDRPADHDGDNEVGWRVLFPVGGFGSAICAVKPVSIWYGK